MDPEERALHLDALARNLRLTRRQRLLAEVATANPDLTGAQMARAADYSGNEVTLAVIASQQLRSAKVQKYIAALVTAAKTQALQHTASSVCTASEILQRMSIRARANLADFIVFTDAGAPKEDEARDPDARMLEHFVFDLRAAFKRGLGPCLQEISFDRDGRPKIRLVDAKAADDTLARWLGMEKVSPEEPPEMAKARAALQLLLANPEHARNLESMSLEVEQRMRVTATTRTEK